jgi:hypothetical protein
MNISIEQSFQILNVSPGTPDEEIVRSYKKLALKYHPDRNRERIDWANDAMTKLNVAYSNVMSYRFRHDVNGAGTVHRAGPAPAAQPSRKTAKETPRPQRKPPDRDELVSRFAALKDQAGGAIYRYFQYGLNNLNRRDTPSNRGIFDDLIRKLRRAYHSINTLSEETKDQDLLNHFSVYAVMLFHFYRASECLNINDSYKNQYDVDAYREYRKGDEALHLAHKEIFFDRHNRGHFKGGHASTELMKAERIFSNTLRYYPNSNWTVETGIKMEYVKALRDYLNLFFTE